MAARRGLMALPSLVRAADVSMTQSLGIKNTCLAVGQEVSGICVERRACAFPF